MNQQQNQNNPADGQSRAGEAGVNLTDVLAAISEREAFENWFNTECSLPDINTIYGTVAWAAWKARAKADNGELSAATALNSSEPR